MRHHVHPLTILTNLWRVLYLTIIPVIRGFLLAIQGDLGQWVQGAWIDILVFLLMVLIAVWRWWLVRYSYDDREMVVDAGWIVRRRIRIQWDRVCTLSVLESFYLRPFHAARLRADTIGGSAGRPDFSILLSRSQADRILGGVRARGGGGHPREYVPQTSSILALALLTSNSLGGILFIAAFVSQAGRLLGNGFSDRLIGTFEEAARTLAFGLPPAAAAIAYILLAGWFIGFMLTFLRYKNFTVSRSRAQLNIYGGCFSKRDYCIHYADINFIDIRQSLVTKVLRLYSLYISAVGYAKQKDDISCIIPTENHATFTRLRERLMPAFSPADRQVRPRATGFMRFVGVALTFCAAIPLATLVLVWLFPAWHSFILFVGLMSLAPALYFLAVRFVDFATGGVAKQGSYYTLRYSKGFYLHTVIVPEDKVVSIQLRQSLFQKFTPNCDLVIHTRAELRFAHLCRNLNKEELQALFRM